MEAHGAVNASREALSGATTTATATQRKRRKCRFLHSAPIHRNVVCALALREARGGGKQQLLSSMPRTQWHLSSVLHRDDALVLLGFSSDGHFLLYYLWWELCFELRWKRVDFGSRSGRFVSHDTTAFRLPVGDAGAFAEQSDRVSSSSLANGVGSSLRVWQSRDHALIVAIATDRHLAGLEALLTQSFHVSIAPAPAFDGGAAAAASAITSLRFAYTVPSPCQAMETWQLLQLDGITTTSSSARTYHLAINMGTSVMILGLQLRTESHHTAASVTGGHSISSGARASMLMQNAWYFPPEFPIELQRETFRRRARAADDASPAVIVECVYQRIFDVERFLQSFLNSYGSLRQLNLVDYDLQLVRASEVEKTLFMSCVMELESSLLPSHGQQPQHQPRFMCMALFFSLHLVTGKYDIIRALRLPRQQQNLRYLSRTLVKKCQHDVDARIPPPEHTATAWDNAPAMQEQSLKCVHNPQFPVSIYFN